VSVLIGKVSRPDFVPVTSELIRISKVPRRVMQPEDMEWLANELTARLRKPRGTMRLKPVQAWALYELGTVGGLFAPVTVGGGKCVAGETEVFDIAAGRRRRVDELGVFEVSTMNAEGKLTTAKTLASRSGHKPCLKLTLRDGSSVVLSTDHPVYTSRGWVHAGELQSSDLIATARSVPVAKQETVASDDEVALAAYLLSDGGVSQAVTTFTNADHGILNEVWSLASRLADHTRNLQKGWKLEGVTAVRQPSRAYEFNISGISWFRNKWGLHGLAKEKRLPAEFWGLPERQLALFINRFWACDGWIEERGPVIVLASEKMIDDLKFLLLRLGIHSRKRFKLSKLGDKSFNSWRLTVALHSVETFFAKVGLIFSKEIASQTALDFNRARSRNTNVDVVPVGPQDIPEICDELGYPKIGGDRVMRVGRPRTEARKFLASGTDQNIGREKFQKFCQTFDYRGRLSWLATSDVCWERILLVEDAGMREVFDLSVPGFGNFVGNNIVLHNTLISLLAPVIMKSSRPLLIVPAGLVEKTKRDKEILDQHWHLPLFMRIMSYEWLGREQASTAIEEWDPDLVILDECHRAKNNRGAAVARRITRFFRDRQKQKKSVVVMGHWEGEKPREKHVTHCAALSGTITKRSIHDYAHILTWCLPEKYLPIPTHWNDLSMWADALDEKQNETRRVDPGALETLCADDADREFWKSDRITAARRTYRRRLIETPGVVATYETAVDASLVVRGVGVEMGTKVDEAFAHLRSKWETPDGWTIPDGMTFARHARELAQGFYLVWDPRPPIEWQRARATWHAFVREILKHSRKHDSEKQVRVAHADSTECQEWLALRDTFKINTRPVWIDSAACEFAASWAKKNAGIIWVENRCVGLRLQEEFGLSYYGKKGLDAGRRFIDDHDRTKSLVASRAANSEGRNLQGWSKNLIMSLLPNGARAEQLLGRTHRPGQFADEVEVDFMVSCYEHLLSLDRALNDARYIELSTGAPQKLLLATLDVDDRTLRGVGPRWNK
jgi:intein/homing endonuclease